MVAEWCYSNVKMAASFSPISGPWRNCFSSWDLVFCSPRLSGMSADSNRIHGLFRRLNKQLSKAAAKVEPRNVHGFRTAARRVEAVLQELDPDPNRNQRRLLKQLTRIRKG